MATSAQEWRALCDEFTAARDEETRLLGLSNQAGGDPDLVVVKRFEAAHQRTEDVKNRMDAWLGAQGS